MRVRAGLGADASNEELHAKLFTIGIFWAFPLVFVEDRCKVFVVL
jgi:hypothetical protein